MKTIINPSALQPTHVCSRCQRELPLELFYMNKRTQCPDRYCKKCRKELSRQQYGDVRIRSVLSEKCPYPVITETADRELRMRLILHAVGVVCESIERKTSKDKLLWQE